MENEIIDKIGLIYIKDRKILVLRSKGKDKFFVPGGKREPGETDEQTLIRECKEEISIDIVPGSLKFVEKFKAEAYGKENTFVQITAYTADFNGEIKPDSEIEELGWHDFSYMDVSTSPMKLILKYFKERDLID